MHPSSSLKIKTNRNWLMQRDSPPNHNADVDMAHTNVQAHQSPS